MNKVLTILKWTAVCVLIVFMLGWVTMILWNWLIPSIFSNASPINFWQALGLLLLSKLLFSGFGKGGHRRDMNWKKRYYQKLSSMSPEDRERCKQRLRDKWCASKTTSVPNTDISND